ncbi:Ankyrin repeat domain containing protein [Balamuthia mandrillaris]
MKDAAIAKSGKKKSQKERKEKKKDKKKGGPAHNRRKQRQLPDEVWYHIFTSFLPPGLLGVVSQTCRQWYSACPSELRHKICLRDLLAWCDPTTLSLLKWAVKQKDERCEALLAQTTRICALAAGTGRVPVLKWAREKKGFPWDHRTATSAARGGHLEVLRWACKKGCPWRYPAVLEAAAEGGNLNLLKWAVQRDADKRSVKWEKVWEGAARHGHLQVLLWLRNNKGEDVPPSASSFFSSASVWAAAAGGGHLEALQWLARELEEEDKSYPWEARISHAAAGGGHVAVLQWMRQDHDNGGPCPWDEETCAAAAKGGWLDALQWARANECPWDEGTCKGAARGGHLKVLQWVREQGCSWDEGTCNGAAEGGHLKVLQWAREQGCGWSERTCSMAASGGQLGMLQWLREKGCPWDEQTCMEAAQGGHLPILQWAAENGCAWGEMTCTALAKKVFGPAGGHEDEEENKEEEKRNIMAVYQWIRGQLGATTWRNAWLHSYEKEVTALLSLGEQEMQKLASSWQSVPLKVTFVGDGSSGKTLLLFMIAHPETKWLDYRPTVFDNLEQHWAAPHIKPELPFLASLWDTSGQEQYARIRTLSYQKTDVIVMCFSLGSESTLDALVNLWIPEIRHHLGKDIPIVLVGTQLEQRPNNQQAVAASQAIAFAKEHKLMAYLECSSLLHINTREIVDECTLLMLTRHKAIKKLLKKKLKQSEHSK